MKRPSTVAVLGKTYKIIYAVGEPLDKDDLGEHDLPNQRITIRDGIHEQQVASAVLHECLHAISDALGIGLNEAQVLALETGLFSLLVDNRDLVSYLGKKR